MGLSQKRLHIALIALLILCVIFSSYITYDILRTKAQLSQIITDKNTQDELLSSYNGAIILIFFLLCLFCLSTVLMLGRIKSYLEVRENATTDHLTKLYNRHYFTQRFEEELERCRRYKHPLSVLMLDLDHFKQYNDKHGHAKGDVLLKEAAEIMQKSTRKIDVVSRWGGEEFVILLAETKGRDAYVVAERIRNAIMHLTKNTVSIGLVYYKYYYPELKEIVEKADQMLYKAKSEGRNKICYK